MKKGHTLVEVLVALALLTLFISGGMSLYVTSFNQTKRGKILLTELWLAKGQIDTSVEKTQLFQQNSGSFSSPFQDYSFNVNRNALAHDPSLEMITVQVKGPLQTKITLQRIRTASAMEGFPVRALSQKRG